MSTVQKVFVVIVFVLSIAFTFLSLQMLATEQRWKDKFVDLENTSQEEIKNLNATITQKSQEIEVLKTKETELEATKRTLTEEKKNVTERNNELELDLKVARQNETSLGENNKVLSNQNEDYKRKLDEMTNKYIKEKKRSEDLVKIYQFKQDELADTIAQYNDLNAKHKDLMARYKQEEEKANGYRVVLSEVKKRYNIDVLEWLNKPLAPETPIDAKVVAVAKDKKTDQIQMVMLSAGRDDGVKEGYQFVIFRDDAYIGKVKVDKVFEDMATGTVIPESLAKDEDGKAATIKQYDSASTRLY